MYLTNILVYTRWCVCHDAAFAAIINALTSVVEVFPKRCSFGFEVESPIGTGKSVTRTGENCYDLIDILKLSKGERPALVGG